MFTQLYPHNKHGGVDLKAIAAEAGACKHFCPSKWAKVRPRASEPLSPALGCVSRRVTAMPPAAARTVRGTRGDGTPRSRPVHDGAGRIRSVPQRAKLYTPRLPSVCPWTRRHARRSSVRIASSPVRLGCAGGWHDADGRFRQVRQLGERPGHVQVCFLSRGRQVSKQSHRLPARPHRCREHAWPSSARDVLEVSIGRPQLEASFSLSSWLRFSVPSHPRYFFLEVFFNAQWQRFCPSLRGK